MECLSQIPIEELFEAYYSCRKKKRNTHNALAFELDYEQNLIQLQKEINSKNYTPLSSAAFIVNQPVKREVFAADFSDRVIHHWLINKINPLFEQIFIEDSYACRTQKGTHLGIRRVDEFIKQCSNEYKRDCYILKLDIKGFFMHINKNLLYERISIFIEKQYHAKDKDLVLDITRRIIYNDPTKNVIIKCSKNSWNSLPKDKSLFHAKENCGLPIGNLTSQVFANFYMNSFDQFIKSIGIQYYGRYVDDFIIVHTDKEYLKELIPHIADFLSEDLNLTLHPKKIYLQHYTKGVSFLGVIIKPHRIYIQNRIKGNFCKAINRQNEIVRKAKTQDKDCAYFLSVMNSYLGIMKHYKTYKLRKRILFKHLSAWWWNHVYLTGGYAKFVSKNKIQKMSTTTFMKAKQHFAKW